MGATPWMYFVPYQSNIKAAFNSLRVSEFQAGRYRTIDEELPFPVDPTLPGPGARHTSIEEACEAAGESGTASILDMARILDEPRQPAPQNPLDGLTFDDGIVDFSAFAVGMPDSLSTVAPLSDEQLGSYFSTPQPTRAEVEASHDFFDAIDRGTGVYVVCYERDAPTWLCFAGYSFD